MAGSSVLAYGKVVLSQHQRAWLMARALLLLQAEEGKEDAKKWIDSWR